MSFLEMLEGEDPIAFDHDCREGICGACEAVCTKSIQLEVIARMNRDYLKAAWTHRGDPA